MIDLLEVNGVCEADMRDLCAEMLIPFSSEVRTTAPVVFRLSTAPVVPARATKIETLTEDETCRLENSPHGVKALRIIDAQAAALARVRAVAEKNRPNRAFFLQLEKALAGSPEAPEADTRAMLYGQLQQSRESLTAANARVVKLEAEAKDWKAERRIFCDSAHRESIKLTAANARAAELEAKLAKRIKSNDANVVALTDRVAAANARAEAAERILATIAGNAPVAFERAESESAALRARADAAERKLTALQASYPRGDK